MSEGKNVFSCRPARQASEAKMAETAEDPAHLLMCFPGLVSVDGEQRLELGDPKGTIVWRCHSERAPEPDSPWALELEPLIATTVGARFWATTDPNLAVHCQPPVGANREARLVRHAVVQYVHNLEAASVGTMAETGIAAGRDETDITPTQAFVGRALQRIGWSKR